MAVLSVAVVKADYVEVVNVLQWYDKLHIELSRQEVYYNGKQIPCCNGETINLLQW
jgi:hypothetical protein